MEDAANMMGVGQGSHGYPARSDGRMSPDCGGTNTPVSAGDAAATPGGLGRFALPGSSEWELQEPTPNPFGPFDAPLVPHWLERYLLPQREEGQRLCAQANLRTASSSFVRRATAWFADLEGTLASCAYPWEYRAVVGWMIDAKVVDGLVPFAALLGSSPGAEESLVRYSVRLLKFMRELTFDRGGRIVFRTASAWGERLYVRSVHSLLRVADTLASPSLGLDARLRILRRWLQLAV
jgi:hypothetical protein